MINLLPPQEKNKIILRQRRKIATILLGAILLFLIILLFVIYSFRIYVNSEYNNKNIQLQTIKQDQQTKKALLQKDLISKYNNDINNLLTFYANNVYITAVLEDIIKIKRPEGLYFTEISIERKTDKPDSVVIISGFSKNRDDLVTLKDLLNKDLLLKNVEFSSSSWIKPENINFNFTAQFKNGN